MIIEGCDILLDVNQVFVRQGNLLNLQTDCFNISKPVKTSGTLIQMLDKPKGARSKFSATFGKGSSDKEAYRLCFLFSYHLILTTRQSDDDGRLNLVPSIGKIPLSDAMLIEDPSESTALDDDGIFNKSVVFLL